MPPPKEPDVPSDQRRLSAMPINERDSILGDIARRTVKEKWPELYREEVYTTVIEGDFSIMRLKWQRKDSAVPDYVRPEDIYYTVTLYYKNWKKERDFFDSAVTAQVRIIEKTREAYKIWSGAREGIMERSLLKPRKEMGETIKIMLIIKFLLFRAYSKSTYKKDFPLIYECV